MSLDSESFRNVVALLSVLMFVISAVLGPISFVKQQRISAYIRANHRELWRELNQPDSAFGQSPASSLTLLRYIMSKSRWKTDDEVLEGCRSTLRLIYLVFVPAFLVLCACLLFIFASRGGAR